MMHNPMERKVYTVQEFSQLEVENAALRTRVEQAEHELADKLKATIIPDALATYPIREGTDNERFLVAGAGAQVVAVVTAAIRRYLAALDRTEEK